MQRHTKNIKIETVDTGSLLPAKYNPREISEKSLDDLRESLSRYGYVVPIIVNHNDVIISGHQRYHLIMNQSPIPTRINIVRLNLNEDDEKALNIVMNKVGGQFDLFKLRDVISELGDSGVEIPLGFTQEDLEDIAALDDVVSDIEIPENSSHSITGENRVTVSASMGEINFAMPFDQWETWVEKTMEEQGFESDEELQLWIVRQLLVVPESYAKKWSAL